MDIYLKQKEKIIKENEQSVTVNDLCDVICFDNKIKNIVVFHIPKNEYKRFVISNIDITKKILEYDRSLCIKNIGMEETIVEHKKPKKENVILEKLKVFLACLVVFAGASTTIMSFHNETEIPDVFDQYFKMFFGYESHNALIIDIPYSFGLALGIIVFFNHIFGKKFTDTPTPIEIEMVKYESDLVCAETKSEEHRIRKAKENG